VFLSCGLCDCLCEEGIKVSFFRVFTRLSDHESFVIFCFCFGFCVISFLGYDAVSGFLIGLAIVFCFLCRAGLAWY
jgi:hypothetical protein